jgi:hypothetical protein
MVAELTFDQKIENIIYEHEQRVNWFVRGINRHCLSGKIFSKIPTERIVELYNVEMDYFIKHKK